MRLLVCGGRDYTDRDMVNGVLDTFTKAVRIDVLIHGNARGADRLAADWAKARGIPTLSFPANWKLYNHQAGPIRNKQMLEEGRPDWVVAFPGGNGTADMVRRANQAGLIVFEVPR